MTLVVLGMMGRMPVAGVTWQVLQYLEGFRRLGFTVSYVEDTGEWSYDPDRNTITDDPTYAVSCIRSVMARYGFAERWAYRAADGRVFGLSASELRRLFERADVLVNLTGATVLRTEHLRVPVRIYLETDPVLPQIEVAKGSTFYIELLGSHTHHFTYGENIGASDCGVPAARFPYRPRRPPVVLDWWPPAAISPGPWLHDRRELASIRQGPRVARPDVHLEQASRVPQDHRPPPPDGATLGIGPRELTRHGWRVTNSMSLSREIGPYRDYILGSRGEFTVAKDQNVRLRSGWFSDRSACYLGAGRPVITQDTAFGKFIPTGEGLFAFNRMEDIVAAFEAINADYERHRRAARAIAETYFKAETVLAKLVEEAVG